MKFQKQFQFHKNLVIFPSVRKKHRPQRRSQTRPAQEESFLWEKSYIFFNEGEASISNASSPIEDEIFSLSFVNTSSEREI